MIRLGTRTLVAVAAASPLLTLAGCVTANDPNLGGVGSNSATPGLSSASSAGSSPSTPAGTSVSWVPPNYGAAKPAVDAYDAFSEANWAAFTDPAHADPATFDKYLTGEAKTLLDANFAKEKAAGLAYRGALAISRVTVLSDDLSGMPPTVTLFDCQLKNPTNPGVEYTVANGKPVVNPPPAVPPPYGHTIKMVNSNGQWLISQFSIDASRTCRPGQP